MTSGNYIGHLPVCAARGTCITCAGDQPADFPPLFFVPSLLQRYESETGQLKKVRLKIVIYFQKGVVTGVGTGVRTLTS